MFISKEKKYLYYYLLFLFFLTLYYLSALNIVETYNAMTEWLINYQGGFVRRGFLGEILFRISKFLEIDLKFSILLVQLATYGTFYYLIFRLVENIEIGHLFLFIIFSPLFLFYPIAELEALGRKEILVSILFLSISIFFRDNKNYKLLLFLFGSIIVLLTHEIIVFYIFNFLVFFLLLNKNNSLIFNIKITFVFIIFIIFTLIVFFNEYSISMKEIMCSSLIKNFDIRCGFQTHYVANPINTYIGEVHWKSSHLLRNSIIYFLGFGPLLILSLFLKFNKNKYNHFITKIPIVIILLCFSVLNLLIFLISVDTGRYFHLAYSNSFIFIFGLIYNQIILIDENKLIYFEKKYLPKKKYLLFLILFFTSFSWSPKATFGEDIGSIPIYRTIEKMPIFFKNIKKIRFKKVMN